MNWNRTLHSLFGIKPFDDSSDDDDGTTVPAADTREMFEERVERTKSYTEHDAVARFAVGDNIVEKEYTFDSMRVEAGNIILADYDGYDAGNARVGGTGFVAKKHTTIYREHLLDFETVERRDREMEYETTVKKPASEVEDA